MGEQGVAYHFVCTHEEARYLIENQRFFWVSNCGCRERTGNCNESRVDVCLLFRDDVSSSGSGMRAITKSDAIALLQEATASNLVTRPFYNDKDRRKSDGICFCCKDCCEYFTQPDIPCDKGRYIEETDLIICDRCGICVDFCYFGARRMGKKDMMLIEKGLCFGCGLCVDACPQGCISLALR